MTKTELIELLESIPGNPDILLWNSFAEDYHYVNQDYVLSELVRHSKDYFRYFLSCEGIDVTDEIVDKAFADQEWELPNSFDSPEQIQRYYDFKRKPVAIFDVVPRGKKTWDRLGNIEY